VVAVEHRSAQGRRDGLCGTSRYLVCSCFVELNEVCRVSHGAQISCSGAPAGTVINALIAFERIRMLHTLRAEHWRATTGLIFRDRRHLRAEIVTIRQRKSSLRQYSSP
jgi:hypothetical protein